METDPDPAGLPARADARSSNDDHHVHHCYQPGTENCPQVQVQAQLPTGIASHPHHDHLQLRSQTNSPLPSSPLPSPNFHDAASRNVHHAFALLNPDDFYKSYRALHNDPDLDTLSMASSSSPRPSLRSNADGSTSKQPTVSPNRSIPRPSNLRTTSNPVDLSILATAGRTPGGKPSVKDLKKRFDQNGGVSSIPRVPVGPGVGMRVRKDGVTITPPRAASQTYANLRSGVAPDSATSTSPRASPRPKFVVGDQVSNNAQSFASRVGKPRTSTSGNPNFSPSSTQQTSKSSPQLLQYSPQPANLPIPGLLFGEIFPDQYDTSALGFGIKNIRPRGVSRSDAHGQWAHQRSLSDPDIEPSSPSSWYRTANTQNNEPRPVSAPKPGGRVRSFSDVAIQKPPKPVTRKPVNRVPESPNPQTSGSKLPISVRMMSSPVNSSSPSSTRSSSPSILKLPLGNGRTSRASTPSTRAKTPTLKVKTPTKSAAGRKAAPPALPTPNSNNRLQAYIGVPPPKLSPPLRSSRPRQPVSMATTASSRLKAVDKPNSKFCNMSPTSSAHTKQSDPATRRRKISIGPIDFEQRREHIRLAYTKSVRENQAQEAREKAAERRRLQIEAAAKVKAAEEAEEAAVAASAAAAIEVSTAVDTSASDIPSSDPDLPSKDHSARKQGAEQEAEKESVTTNADDSPTDHPVDTLPESPAVAAVQPLSGSTTSDLEQPIIEASIKNFDLPTLEVPGSFPSLVLVMNNDDVPLSAVSVTSETTEFDIEPLATSPVPSDSPIEIPITIVNPMNPPASSIPSQTEYQYPFDDELDSPDQQIAQETIQDLRTNELNNIQQSIPGAFEDYYGCSDSPTAPQFAGHEAIVTIFPPRDERLLAQDIDSPTIPFPRMDMEDESDCHTEFEDPREPESRIDDDYEDREDANTDACTEYTDDQGKTDDCQSESRFGDNLSSRRASSCASSDSGGGGELQYSHYDQPAENRSNTLLPSSRRTERSNLHSAWTDTVDSGNRSYIPTSNVRDQVSPIYSNVTIYGLQADSKENEPPAIELYSEADKMRASYDSARSSSCLEHHQLPDIEIGEDFTIPYLSQEQSTSSFSIPLPDHEPPPVPTPAAGSAINSRRVSSNFYDQSQYGITFMHSERGSEEFVSQLETPQTVDTMSTGGPDQYFGVPSQASDLKFLAPDGEELSDKERHRLVQRRNVIKEIVDTEAVFVRDMNIVEEIYKGTAEACPKLDSKTVKQIFRNTDEIIDFHTTFLAQIKEAVASIYVPKGGRSSASTDGVSSADLSQSSAGVVNDAKDRATSIGPVFKDGVEKMKTVHEGFLRSSDQAAKKLIQIQQDPGVKVWLNECNEVAKDLTAAWDLDSLLIKPMQRITKYPNLIITLLQHTPQDHPDREALASAKDILETAIIEINKTKKNFELVGQIVGRKRKESDVKTGIARAFGKRVDKTTGSRVPEDPEYAKLNERFGDDYLRLQVVLRDVEFYTRQVATYVREFLNYISSIELVMRLSPGVYPEIESKWVQFNISIRDLEKVALEEHLAQVRQQVIEPFEQVIKAYGNPSLAMKKRQKRRLDFERMEQLKRGGKTADSRLQEQVEHYDALNDTLKKELPKLSALTEKVGNICLENLVNIQANWFGIWKEKMKTVLDDCPDMPDLQDVVLIFERDFPYPQEQVASIGILQPAPTRRPSQSTAASSDEVTSKIRSPRPSDVDIARSRNISLNGESAPSLPTPDFLKRNSGFEPMSPTGPKGAPSPHQYYYRDYYAGMSAQPSSSASAMTLEKTGSTRSLASRSLAETGATSTRPSTGRSFESGPVPRQSTDSTSQYRRDSHTTFNSNHLPHDNRRFSGLFHSALPMPDGPEEGHRLSRASSRERAPANDGYNVLWLAASLFEFNIATTKHEAGYPYLIYQAGEIFDVIAEKGELWLAKNQDDHSDQVGWIWSKHFAKLADS